MRNDRFLRLKVRPNHFVWLFASSIWFVLWGRRAFAPLNLNKDGHNCSFFSVWGEYLSDLAQTREFCSEETLLIVILTVLYVSVAIAFGWLLACIMVIFRLVYRKAFGVGASVSTLEVDRGRSWTLDKERELHEERTVK